jgi:hypothetical protein
MPGPVTCELVARETVCRMGGESIRRHAGSASSRRVLRIERQPGAALRAELGELLVILGEESVPSQCLDEELQAVRLLVLVIAELVKHTDDRLGDVEYFRRRQKLVHRRGRLHHDRRAAADDDAESAHAVLDGGAIAEVVHPEQRVIFVGAAFERDLEFRGSEELSGWRSR